MPSDSYSIQAFCAGLQQFSADDYTRSDRPWMYLAGYVGGKKVLYQQFSETMIQDAKGKGAEEDTVRSRGQRITERLEFELDHSKSICALLNRKARELKGSGKILLMPIMCGIGKSTAIVRRMKQALQSKEGESLLIITDSNERLAGYQHPLYPKELKDYFDRQDVQDRICLFTADTKAEALRRADHAQVLLMATQRYLHLSPEELDRFTRCNGVRRSMIIVDEEPEIEEYAVIRFSDLAGAVSAFIQGLLYTGTEAYVQEKEWCTALWKRIAGVISEMLHQADEESGGRAGYYHFMKPEALQDIPDEDEQRFMRFIHEHSGDLNRYQGRDEYDAVTAQLEAVFAMIRHGALFCSRNDRQNDKTCFKLFVDHMKQFNVPDTTIVILDGTADLSPVYRFHEEWFRRIPAWRFRRSLANLHVHILDERTGSAFLQGQQQLYYDALFQDIRERLNPYLAGMPCTVFTHKKIREKFGFDNEFGSENVFHFGNIKGINQLKDRTAIAQMGIPQYPQEDYFLMSLIGDREAAERFAAMSAEEQRSEIIREADTEGSASWVLRNACQLVATEQCIFRGCIREVIGSEYHYFIWCRAVYYRSLIEAMKQRYEGLDGSVTVTEKSLAEEIDAYMRRGRPNQRGKQIIRAILAFSTDAEFQARDIYHALNTTYQQYKQTVHDTPVIRRLLAYDQVGPNAYRSRFRMPQAPDVVQQPEAAQRNEAEQELKLPSYMKLVERYTKENGEVWIKFLYGGRLCETYLDDTDDEDNGLPF